MTAAADGVLDDAALRRVVAVLCLGQITSWGVLYYALPVLATTITRDTGWPAGAVIGAFSLGLVINAVAGIGTGRLIDRRGPRLVMTTGSGVAAAGLVAVAVAPNLPLFLGAWVLVGIAMSGTLYAPAFAAVTGWAGGGAGRRIRALTAVTLVGGLASTVFAPLTAALSGPLDWRQTYVVLAVVLAVVTIPAHGFGLRDHWGPPLSTLTERGAIGPGPSRQPAFWITTATFTLATFAVYAAVVNLVPLLQQNGTSTATASVVLGIGGVGQVAGRLVWAPVVARTGLVTRTVGVFSLVGLTTAALALVPGSVIVLAVLAFVAGTGRGVVTLLLATSVSDRWGVVDFGRHHGLLNAPVMVAAATSPWAGSVLASALGSYSLAFIVLAGSALLAATLVPLTTPRHGGR